MFSKFKYQRIPLSLIKLDYKNPRIVTQQQLKTPDEIIKYLFDHENLADFLKKIAGEGKNQGAERPYAIKDGKEYIVIEGNRRIACYKLLTGQLKPPSGYETSVPHLPAPVKEELVGVDCSIAPSRDALLPIMANAHFGLGDKSKWGYLGSRKVVYDEWKEGKSINQLATAFERKKGTIRDYILEYELYLEALKLPWTQAEKDLLTDPAVEFNPPVRFLQTMGHKAAVGIELDRVNLAVAYQSPDARPKFQHIVRKLVISSEKGLGATASYSDVFSDYTSAGSTGAKQVQNPQDGKGASSNGNTKATGDSNTTGAGNAGGKQTENPKLKPGALFNYQITSNNLLLKQLMKESSDINSKNFPAASTSLLRSLIEAMLKLIIDDQNANPQGKFLSLETALDICLSNSVNWDLTTKRS